MSSDDSPNTVECTECGETASHQEKRGGADVYRCENNHDVYRSKSNRLFIPGSDKEIRKTDIVVEEKSKEFIFDSGQEVDAS